MTVSSRLGAPAVLLTAGLLGAGTVGGIAYAQGAASTAPAASGQAVAGSVVSPVVDAAAPATLRPGSKGAQVATLQKRLARLGYWVGAATGTYGQTTTQAVLAVQKVAGLKRTGIADAATQRAVAKGVRPSAHTHSGHVIEVDKTHQVLKIVDNGTVKTIINTSTGSGKRMWNPGTHRWFIASTPVGSYRIGRQINGVRHAPLGDLYRPKYFNGGIAIHGDPDIPGYPASHGCARVSNAAMDYIWKSGVAPIGTRVVVY